MLRTNALFVVLSVAAHLSTSLAAPIDQDPSEIAPYTVVKKAKDYEIRSYPPAKWVCRDHVASNFRNRDQALSFFDLFDYITGQNSAEIDIDMTAPVTVYTKPNADDQGNTLYQMCFYVPSIHQADPPVPKADKVYLEDRPSMIIAARQFGGFMKRQTDWEVQMSALKADLKADNELTYNLDNFYGSTYDSPFKFAERRNEVWVVKTQ